MATKSKQAKQQTSLSEADRNSLRKWNLAFAGVLAVLAVAIVLIGGSQTVPLTTQYLAKDALASEAAGHQVLAVAVRHLWDVPIAWLVAKFLLIFALAYLLAATLWRGKYEAWLDRGVNKLRWAALGVGGGVVVTAVAMLSGVSDASTITLTFGSVVLAGLLAAALELLGAERRLGRLLAVGAVAAVFLPWLIFVRSIGSVPMFGGSLPNYMYYLYASTTLLLVAVGLAMHMRIRQRGKWANTLYAERMFMILSFLLALLPSMQIFAGALQS